MFSIDGIEAAVTTRTREHRCRARGSINHAGYSGVCAHAIKVQRVKLFAPPLAFGVRRQTERRNRRSQRELILVETLPLPLTTHHRITKRSAVRSAHRLAVIHFLVLVRVTLSA